MDILSDLHFPGRKKKEPKAGDEVDDDDTSSVTSHGHSSKASKLLSHLSHHRHGSSGSGLTSAPESSDDESKQLGHKSSWRRFAPKKTPKAAPPKRSHNEPWEADSTETSPEKPVATPGAGLLVQPDGHGQPLPAQGGAKPADAPRPTPARQVAQPGATPVAALPTIQETSHKNLGLPVEANPNTWQPMQGAGSAKAEIAVVGAKGEPKEVLKDLQRRGFVVYIALEHTRALGPDGDPKLVVAELKKSPVAVQLETELTKAKGDEKVALQQLQAQGVDYRLHVPSTVTEGVDLALGLGPKLLLKMALAADYGKRDKYAPSERAVMAKAATEIIKRSGLKYKEAFLLHDPRALAGVYEKKTPDAIVQYFGSGVALYFQWLLFYTKCLAVPAVGGLLLCLSQWRGKEVDTPLVPLFCVLLAVWGTLFLEFWKRENSAVAFRWGVLNVENDEVTRDLAAQIDHPTPPPGTKYCVTIPIVALAVYTVVRVMLYCMWLSDNAASVFGKDSYMKHWPTLLYSAVPVIAGKAYNVLAALLNDWEGHSTARQRKDSLIMKHFAFQFVNCYCALFYIAFWLQDMARLRSMLFSLCVTKQVLGNLVEGGVPELTRWYNNRGSGGADQAKAKQAKKKVLDVRPLVLNEEVFKREDFERELQVDAMDIGDDYLEMVLQFGYSTMFAVAWPLAPLMALANNLFEYRLDLHKLTSTRRVRVQTASDIGSWYTCLEFVSYAATLTNCCLLALVSDNIGQYVPASWGGLLKSTEGKVVIAVMAEHLLLLAKFLLAGLIDDQPRWVRERTAKIQLEQQERDRKNRLVSHNLKAGKKEEDPEEKAHRVAVAKLKKVQLDNGGWSFSPIWFLPLAITPYAVGYMGWSMLWTLPVAFLLVSYLQSVKAKNDVGIALGVVSDASLLRLIHKELPRWFYDSEVERAEWINKIMAKLWPAISGAAKGAVDEYVAPMIDYYRPNGITALGFRKVDLGTIPPKITGARVSDMQDRSLSLDLEMKWTSNANFVMEVGRKGFPLIMSVSDIKFSGKMRVELAPLVPKIPCFGALAFTFMEKPYVDFKFSIAGLDIMSIGPAEYNIGEAVSQTIKWVVQFMMLYPTKMVVPVMPDADVKALANPAPDGILQLRVVGAQKLRKADIQGKSDPFIKISLGTEQVKTKVIKNSIDPQWNEDFDFMIHDPKVQFLSFAVYDEDWEGDDRLGTCELALSALEPNHETQLNLPLQDTSTGSIQLRATYIPLVTNEVADPDEDVIFNVDDDRLADEVLAAVPDSPPAAPRRPGAPSPRMRNDNRSSEPRMPTDPTDDSMGVLTVTNLMCAGIKPAKNYLVLVQGNTRKQTAVDAKKAIITWPETFHFLVRGTSSAQLEVTLMDQNRIGSDDVVGKIKIRVQDVIVNDNSLEQEFNLAGDGAQGTLTLRLKFNPARTNQPSKRTTEEEW